MMMMLKTIKVLFEDNPLCSSSSREIQSCRTWSVIIYSIFLLSPIHLLQVCSVDAIFTSNMSDRLALLSIKSWITKDPSGALLSWNESLHFCDWQGVTCGGEEPQRVKVLDLSSLDLAGSISPFITNLTSIQRLNLPNNRLNGQIPQDIGRLSQLQHLNLSTNFLENQIPSTLSQCSKLQNISLKNNMLQGEIPANLTSCLDLQIISLSNNSLMGEIPTQLGLLPKLSFLSLGSNNLIGTIPSSLGNNSYLVYLHLSGNMLSGDIPDSLGNLSALTLLDLGDNSLSGDIPRSLTQLSSLTYLDLSVNNLSGGIPEAIGKLSSLNQLHFSRNQLSGAIPSSLYNLSSFQSLNLASNKISGTLPQDLGYSLSGLQQLDMFDNQFSGSIPSSLSNATGLKRIQLHENRFTGTIPRNLGVLQRLFWLTLYTNQLETRDSSDWNFLTDLTNCSKLRVLILSHNMLGGTLPNSIANLSTSIQSLNLGHNQISGSLTTDIGRLVNLSTLDLGPNFLTGPVPSTIGELHELRVLDLSENRFTEEIPSAISNLTQLTKLYFEHNDLRGSIPASLGDCLHLELLDLSYNQLTGTIPREVVSLSSLATRLFLDNNFLVGSLPAEVGRMKNLNAFSVPNNKLSGEIPSNLGECLIMDYLDLGGNLFSGDIPSTLSHLKGLQMLDLSSNNLSGNIPVFLEGFRFLKYLNLSYNNLEGEVPTNGIFTNVTAVSVTGNSQLCGGSPGLRLPPCHAIKNKPKFPTLIMVVLAISLCCILAFCMLTKCRWIRKAGWTPSSIYMLGDQHMKVSYSDLIKATDGLSSSNLIGYGSFGSVYKGTIHRRVVAVKVLNLQQSGSSQSFTAECEAMRYVRHRNLVRILTSCSTVDFKGNDFKALVYEFMPNGSLESWLHPEAHGTTQLLSLTQRLNIAIDVASALEYLHYQTQIPIVHHDLKPSNVLLDEDMTAHVGDFGLAKFVSQSSTPDPTSSYFLRGSIGYVAPECGLGSQVSTQRDVYSYGILVLEMFTGKTPTDDSFRDAVNIRKFVEMAFPERVMSIIDPELLQDEKQEVVDSIRNRSDTRSRIQECLVSVIRIALLCSTEQARERMKMGEVAREMEAVRSAFLRTSTSITQ